MILSYQDLLKVCYQIDKSKDSEVHFNFRFRMYTTVLPKTNMADTPTWKIIDNLQNPSCYSHVLETGYYVGPGGALRCHTRELNIRFRNIFSNNLFSETTEKQLHCIIVKLEPSALSLWSKIEWSTVRILDSDHKRNVGIFDMYTGEERQPHPDELSTETLH